MLQFAKGARAVVVSRVLKRVFVRGHHLSGRCVHIKIEDSDFGGGGVACSQNLVK